MKENIESLIVGGVVIVLALALMLLAAYGCRQCSETERENARQSAATEQAKIKAGLVQKPAMPERWEKP